MSLSPSRLAPLCRQIIEACLYICFFLTPLIVLPITNELFEFNKMYLTYALAVVLLAAGLATILLSGRRYVNFPRLGLLLLIFLVALLLSTLTSIDQQVSLFGFYGRFHGGLFSWIAYAIIFFSLSFLPAKSYLNLVRVALFSALLVSIWGILEHYGIDASYWVENVRARVFSTLGQPNWLAAYLAMIIPWGLSFYLLAKKRLFLLGWAALILACFTAIIFTYSRGGVLGLVTALAAFLLLLGWNNLKRYLRQLLGIAVGMAILTVAFASPVSPQISGDIPYRTVSKVELADETGNIRLIVWQGAVEIFKHYPIFGSGVETFGESYYGYRPVEMNKTSEWDFLFNKAHNEYLNYLATTGVVGTGAYLILILAFFWLGWRQIKKLANPERIFLAAALSSTAGYLVQNAFEFTVVPLALLFVLNLSVFSLIRAQPIKLRLPLVNRIVSKAALAVTPLLLIWTLLTIFNFWRSDIYYSQGSSDASLGDSTLARQELRMAVSLNPTEPNYLIQLALTESYLAQNAQGQTQRDLAASSHQIANLATKIAPKNLAVLRLKAFILEKLSALDDNLTEAAEKTRVEAAGLAPTEPKVRLELADYYFKRGLFDQAAANFVKAFSLKANLIEAPIGAAKAYLKLGQPDSAKKFLELARQINPDDPSVTDLSKDLGS